MIILIIYLVLIMQHRSSMTQLPHRQAFYFHCKPVIITAGLPNGSAWRSNVVRQRSFSCLLLSALHRFEKPWRKREIHINLEERWGMQGK
jgi:hypothetical protein